MSNDLEPYAANPNSPNQVASENASAPPPNKGGRCLLYGCLGIFVGGFLLILCAGFGTYFFVRNQVEKYTETQPKELPSVEYTDEQVAELEKRIEDFQAAVTADGAEGEADNDQPDAVAIDELVLTADEINALIANEEKTRDKIFVKIEDGKVTGDISVPLEGIIPGGDGRYFNGSGTFGIRLEAGNLYVTLEAAQVKGEAVPEQFMAEVRKQNLAKDFQMDPKGAEMIRKFESIEVVDDKIVVKLKGDESEGGAGSQDEATADAPDQSSSEPAPETSGAGDVDAELELEAASNN